MSSSTTELTILILSCDKYSDMWPLVTESFSRYWSNCPYSIYLLSNLASFSHTRVSTLCVGHDESWSTNLKLVLEKIPSQYVLLWLDDVLLNDHVDTQRVEEAFQFISTQRGDYLRLTASPRSHRHVNTQYSFIAPVAIYRTSIFASIWRKSCLLDLLQDGESAWDFEILGTERSRSLSQFYSARSSLFSYQHCLIRSIWLRSAFRYVRTAYPNHFLDLNVRPRMTVRENAIYNISRLKGFVLFNLVPEQLRGVFLRRYQYLFKAKPLA